MAQATKTKITVQVISAGFVIKEKMFNNESSALMFASNMHDLGFQVRLKGV